MNCAHLFNGIGGFALAAHRMGWTNVMHCEIDPFCNKVMNHQFPNSYQHEDIRTTDFTVWRGRIDLLTGGFPCQPYSTAGQRKGTADDRHLWPEMLRAIREIQPGWIVGENVRGLTNWNGGLVFDQVQAELEDEGYEVLPFLLPACGVGAPHRRDRIWFIAHAPGGRYRSRQQFGSDRQSEGPLEIEKQRVREWNGENIRGVIEKGNVANSESFRRSNGIAKNQRQACRKLDISVNENSLSFWNEWPTQSPVCSGNDGFTGRMVDWPVPSKSGTRILTGRQVYGRWRKESIKALGNAVVPQVVYQIFKAIEQYEQL